MKCSSRAKTQLIGFKHALAALVLGAAPTTVYAEVVTIKFSGTFEDGSFGANDKGKSFSGSFYYNTNDIPFFTEPASASYELKPGAFTVDVDGMNYSSLGSDGFNGGYYTVSSSGNRTVFEINSSSVQSLNVRMFFSDAPFGTTTTPLLPGRFSYPQFGFFTFRDSTRTGGPFNNTYASYGPTFLTVVALPEPGTWAMMIGGFGFVGGTLRRRKRQRTPAVFDLI